MKISIIQNCFWVTFNQGIEENLQQSQSFWAKADLHVDEDSEIIADLCQNISLDEFLFLT